MPMNLKPTDFGLLNLPANPNQRGAHKPKRTALDKINDTDTQGFMHPTKGYRHVSAKRAVAARITAEMRSGWTGRYSTERIARELGQ